MNGKEFREIYSTKTDYEALATNIARNITIRDYIETGSRDTTRKATKQEREVIAKVAVGAMDTYGYCGDDADASTICNMAEFILMQFLPEANTYDTIYIPLMKVFGRW